MTQQYDNNMSGALFINNRRQSDRSPDFTGSCEINGQEFWVNGWNKQGKTGQFMSLSFKPKESNGQHQPAQGFPQAQGGFPQQSAQPQAVPQQAAPQGGLPPGDDIPF